jgi:lysophospholipase L1-like esterase
VQESAAGQWVGSLIMAYMGTLTQNNCWPGWHDTRVMVGGREPTPAEVRALVNHATKIYKLSVLGDSITVAAGDNSDWSWLVAYNNGWKSSNVFRINHAEAQQGIVAGAHNLAYQAAAAANDQADVILIALGTNDDNTAGAAQTAIQAALGAGIDALKVSNANATLIVLNVWPRYDGANLDNIRASISTVCAAKGITCWDTYSTPWFADGDTVDHLHPAAAGTAKIVTQVMARLPA